jgi:phage terminase large subunit-like protein
VRKYTHVDKAKRYARNVLSGKQPACKLVRLACERFQKDLKRKDLEFRPDAANAFCRFMECLPHVKGEWAARKEYIVMEDWQCFQFANLFGFYRKATGLRRYQESYNEVPRKNAKSIEAAVVGLFMLTEDGETGAEVFCGAKTEYQADKVFRPARQMALKESDFREWYGVEVRAKSIYKASDGSLFQRIIGDPGDGDSPHCWIVDEFHEHKKDNLYRTGKTGMGARQQPLMFIITTAGEDIGGPCFQKREECIKILQGVYADESADSTFVLIYTIDQDKENYVDPFSVKALKMANPNYNVSVSGNWLRKEQLQAKRSAKDRGAFLTKHLNVWVNATEAFLNYEDWRRCADASMRIEDYQHLPMMFAIDLATRIDFVASVKCFYWFEDDGALHYAWFPEFWLPEARVQDPQSPDAYRTWAEEGLINLCPGDEISTKQVRDKLIEDINGNYLEEVIFDPWKSAGYEQEIEESTGHEIIRFGQTISQYTAPMDELEAAVLSGRLHHPDNPVLNWMCTNLTARRDTNGNKKPRKDDPAKKIDGMSAGIMALGRAMTKMDGDGDMPEEIVSI